MLIVDDLLLLPFRGLLWLVREVASAVEQEQEREDEQVKEQLRVLYMKLETGQMTEEEFELEESRLLDALDAIAARKERLSGEGSEEGGDSNEDDDDAGDGSESHEDGGPTAPGKEPR